PAAHEAAPSVAPSATTSSVATPAGANGAGLGAHQHDVAAPVGAQAAGQHPDHPVAPPEPRAGASTQGDGELLPEEQVLEHERPAAAERGAQRADEERHPVEHGSMMARGADRPPDGVLAPYSSTT